MAADKDKDLSGATAGTETEIPPELQHDPMHSFTVVRATDRPGTAGPSDTVQTGKLSGRDAIDWIKQEISRL
jgi:hypothetical protein